MKILISLIFLLFVPAELWSRENSCLATPAQEKLFKELCNANWKVIFSDDCTGDWNSNWLLDGKVGYVENSSDGMSLHAGAEIKNNAHHAVLWTKQKFSGDLMIEYEHTRLDNRDRQVNILYIQATGSGEGKYVDDIFQWNALREVPAMNTYFDNMNLLHISYAAFSEDGDYVRARRYRPDFNTGLQGTDLGSTYNTGFFEKGVKHKITVIKKGYDLFMRVTVNHKSALYAWNYKEHPEISAGPIGLRHMFSRSSQYKNFVVKELRTNELPAFPGAEGFGRFSTGGRRGDVYHVTNLKDSGSGSLRYGIETANGPRTIVFDTSGNIMLKSSLDVDKSNITIAGQTAPGDGITLGGGCLRVKGDNIIIRYVRARLGDESGGADDAVSIGSGSNIILDHLSASWSVDETLSDQGDGIDLITIQWCMVTESLSNSKHNKGEHGYGGIIGGLRQSFHHNLYAHHASRNPKVSPRRHCKVDFRNNVIYNWGFNSCYDAASCHVNWANNYYKSGPATSQKVRGRIFQLIVKDKKNAPEADLYKTLFYADGNYVSGFPKITADNWAGGIDFENADEENNRALKPFDYPAITEQTAEGAYPLVLKNAGASLARDSIDKRIVNEVITGTATFGNNGIIDSQRDVGGWPVLNSLPAPQDTDQDGMPDQWEKQNQLNPKDPADRNGDRNNDGYTNLEEYLNSLTSI